jgi:hypothetical protein
MIEEKATVVAVIPLMKIRPQERRGNVEDLENNDAVKGIYY